MNFKASITLISNSAPCCKVLGYAHLGIAVSNLPNSIEFLGKIGFNIESSHADRIALLRNRGGLGLELFLCDQGIEDNKNILMDYPVNKYPGHTHASFTVPNTLSAKSYLESQGIVISGERKYPGNDRLFAVFARDPDMTTYEFEKNFGEDEDVTVTRDLIGYPQSMDHVGIRVFNPQAAITYYAEKLGFNKMIRDYEPNPEKLKNGSPWITRAESESGHCEINFIINANEEATKENILLANGIVRPGIIYTAFQVEDVARAEQNLFAAGARVTREEDVKNSPRLACLVGKFQPSPPGKTSFFLEDDEFNLLRIVSV